MHEGRVSEGHPLVIEVAPGYSNDGVKNRLDDQLRDLDVVGSTTSATTQRSPTPLHRATSKPVLLARRGPPRGGALTDKRSVARRRSSDTGCRNSAGRALTISNSEPLRQEAGWRPEEQPVWLGDRQRRVHNATLERFLCIQIPWRSVTTDF